jgi:MFS superfamily sulfate permease-like transporter
MALADEPDRAPLLFASLRGWQASWLPGDALAGLLLAAIALPEQLATARLAGLPPATGLVAFIAGTLGFAVFGSNRFLSCGADSTIAPIFAGGLALIVAGGTMPYASAAALLALLVGLILIVASVLRAGWIADLLSVPVITGFLAGIAVHIIVGQLPGILGVADAPGRLPMRLVGILRHLPDAHPAALAIGAGVLLVMLVGERLAPRLPTALIALVFAIAIVPVFHLGPDDVAVLGQPPALALHPGLPTINGMHDLESMLPLAFIVALVCIMQSAAVLRAYPSEAGGPRHVSRDFGGVGAGCVLAGLFGAFAVNASPPRTAVVAESGGHTQLAGMVAVVLAAALALFGGGVLAVVPQAALGGLLVSIGCRIFRLNEMMRIARTGGREILLVVISAASVVVLPIETGMLVSIVLSLLHSFTIIARPLCTELLRVPGTTVWWPPMEDEATKREPGVLVFALAAPINFTNANYVSRRLTERVAATPGIRLVVLEASGMIDIDYTGSGILQQVIAQLRDGGMTVALARLSVERALAQAQRTGLIDALGQDHVFRSVDDAVRTLRAWTNQFD